MKDIIDFLKENRKDIEDKFGFALYESGCIKGFKIFNDSIQLELNNPRRKTFPVKISNLEEKCFLQSIDLNKVKTKFSIFGLSFQMSKNCWTDVSWSELLFFD